MYEVIGLNDFTSKKNGKRTCMVYLAFESDNIQGRGCEAVWVPADVFDSLHLSVGDVVGAPSYNRRGFFNGFLPACV